MTIYDKNKLMNLAPSIIKNSIMLKVAERLIEGHIIDNIQFLVWLDRIDKMTEAELDYVARELHVDLYDITLPLETKKKLCKVSFSVHAKKGTVKAVTETLDVFYEKSRLIECYMDQQLQPGTFKIELFGQSKDNLGDLIKRMETVKKKSQHFNGIVFKNRLDMNLYFINSTLHSNRYDLREQTLTFDFKKINLINHFGGNENGRIQWKRNNE